MSIKLFLTDLDGTLLPTGQKVSPKNIKAVQDMVKAGIIVTIATGRMYCAALPIAKSLNVDVPLITYNGALIKSVNGEVYYDAYLEPSTVGGLIEFCERKGWHLQGYCDDVLYYANRNDFAKLYEAAVKVNGLEVGWNGLRKYVKDVPKMLIISKNAEQTDERIEILKSEFGDKIDAFRSNANYIEITRHNVSKASALKILEKKFNVDNSETMAIGDSYNDVPMLKAAGKSIAMGNATEDVKNICDYVTGNCVDDGFAQAIYNFVI